MRRESAAGGIARAQETPEPGGAAKEREHGRKAVEAASFVILGFGLSQAIRLAGNIVLTRLLAPEVFGVITIARVFYLGLGLFSDVGLEPAIIRSRRSDDPVFLDTAWTIQIIRSVILAALSAAIAYPVSLLYKEPSLFLIIPAIGLTSVPDGCRSTSLTMLGKELQQKKLTYMELAVQIASLLFTVGAALLIKNIWALMVGDLVGAVMRTVWSHAINRRRPNRLAIEREALGELLTFGKWILVSTAMMFLATQADRFILGKLFSMSWFGVYSVALNLAELPKQVIGRLNEKVIYPLITKYLHLSHEELREKMRRPRWRLLLALALLLSCFGCFGDLAIYILYDERYRAAAWILPMLAFGMWPLMLLSTIEGSLLAIGRPKYSAAGNFAKFLYMVTILPLSYRIGGEMGAVLAIALNDLPSYAVINVGLARERLSLFRQDLALTACLLASSGLLLGLRVLLGLGTPGNCPLFPP